MLFPNKSYENASSYALAYFDELTKAQNSVNAKMIETACTLVEQTYKAGKTVFFCGNGGSSALANHMVCDHGKLIATNTKITPKVISLSNSSEMLTAIANDISFSDVFSYQLGNLGSAEDVLVVVSGSGNSENVVKALEMASSKGIKTIALTAFDGGKCKELADVSIHVDIENYGIAEDIHQSILQIIAQFIRMNNLDPNQTDPIKY